MTREELLEEALKEMDRLIERLDQAMATKERIAQDTLHAGGFVSSLNLAETAEQIVDRAIMIIEDALGEWLVK